MVIKVGFPGGKVYHLAGGKYIAGSMWTLCGLPVENEKYIIKHNMKHRLCYKCATLAKPAGRRPAFSRGLSLAKVSEVRNALP